MTHPIRLIVIAGSGAMLLAVGMVGGWFGYQYVHVPSYASQLAAKDQQLTQLQQQMASQSAELQSTQDQVVGYQQYAVAHADTSIDATKLTGYILPIKGLSPVYSNALTLPNSPRSYRGGVHEGLDFPAKLGSSARAIGDGTIIRIDRDYAEPSAAQLQQWAALAEQVQFTPDQIFDALRGRQVWLLLPGNVIVRYCHLGQVADLQLGQQVKRGQEVGKTGASGTLDEGPHLHFEIRLAQGYLGQGQAYGQLVATLQKFFSAPD